LREVAEEFVEGVAGVAGEDLLGNGEEAEDEGG
jgi:hypothetical protein